MIVEGWVMWQIRECAFGLVEWGPHVGGERIGHTMRQGNNLEWRAGSFCVVVDGDNEAAAATDRIPKVGVRNGSVCNNPTILPEPIDKI